MSILPPDLMRKIAVKSHDEPVKHNSSRVSERRFQELMRTSAIDEDRPKDRDLFGLLTEEEEKPSSNDEENSLAIAACASLPSLNAASLTSSAIAMQAVLSAELEALFEQMATSMIMLCSSGESETTIFLDNPHFASSVFFGSTITIREFSTAPKAFNVEFASLTASAVAALEASKQSLFNSFQKNHFNFSVHRIDAHLQDKPVFREKEKDDQQEQKGGQQ